MSVAALAIGAISALASAVIGAVSSSNANKRAQTLIDTQQKEDKRWYEQKKNEDYMNRSEVQAVLKKQRETLDEYYKRSRATNVITGGTDEAAAMAQEAANKTIADTSTNIAAQATAYKDSLDKQSRESEKQYNQMKVGSEQAKANQIAQAASAGVSAGINLAGSTIKSSATGSGSGGNGSEGTNITKPEDMKQTLDLPDINDYQPNIPGYKSKKVQYYNN